MELEPPEDESLTTYDAMHILRNERRATIIKYTENNLHEEPWPMDDIVSYVCEFEYEKPIEHVTSVERKRIHVGLYQHHMPLFKDHQVINPIDERERIFERGDNYPEVAEMYQTLFVEDDETTLDHVTGWVRNIVRRLS